jgi:hypothetical protein
MCVKLPIFVDLFIDSTVDFLDGEFFSRFFIYSIIYFPLKLRP